MVAPNPPDGTADILLLPAKDQLVQGHPLELQAGSSQPPIHPKGSLTEIPLDSEDHVRGLAAHVQLSAPETVPPPLPTDLRGWRLVAVMLCLCFALFLSALETTIVATALVGISSDFGDYGSSSWVVVAYMITYTGFMIIYARLSDVFGRKAVLLAALVIFGVFSLACGLAQTMTQLIILRAFQGMGASGMYSMSFVIIPEIVPLRLFGQFSAVMGAVFAVSSILGPILGGIVVNSSSWRWVFLLNVPCILVIVVITIAVFPHSLTRRGLRKGYVEIDWPGMLLSLGGSVLLVFALEQAGGIYPWQSPVIVGTLVGSFLCWVFFVGWEQKLSHPSSLGMMPIFPLRIIRRRVLAAAFLSAFLNGFPFVVTLISLPQRFQIVNGLSPVEAGIRMLPLLAVSAVGSGLSGIISSKHNLAFYTMTGGQALQVIGMGLMSSTSTDLDVHPSQYGVQAILGLGFGLGLSSLILLARAEADSDDSAIIMATITQVRVLGGCIGLSIASVIFISRSTTVLAPVLSPAQIASILQSAATIADLPRSQMLAVRSAFGDSLNLQMRAMLGVSALTFLVGLFAWRSEARTWESVRREQEERERERIELRRRDDRLGRAG